MITMNFVMRELPHRVNEDLIVSGLDDLRASLKERQRQARIAAVRVGERVFAFSHEVFAHTDEHREIFRHMAGKRSGDHGRAPAPYNAGRVDP
jgi:hypothetical protein